MGQEGVGGLGHVGHEGGLGHFEWEGDLGQVREGGWFGQKQFTTTTTNFLIIMQIIDRLKPILKT